MNQPNNNLNENPSISTMTENDLAVIPDVVSHDKDDMLDGQVHDEVIKTEIVYSNLLDKSELPLAAHAKVNSEPATSTIETYRIISNQLLPNKEEDTLTNGVASMQQSTSINIAKKSLSHSRSNPENISNQTHKSEALTDRNILAKSKQQVPTNDTLEYDKNATGVAIEHMGVALKQWLFTLHWQSTQIPKTGFINKLKKRTQTLDLDLACLLCNRYGEVIERVWFKNVRDHAESIRHQGDELIGTKPPLPSNIEAIAHDPTQPQQEAYDPQMNLERIAIYLKRIPPQIFHVIFIASSYHGYPLSNAIEGYCELGDDEGNIISRISLSSLPKDCSAIWFASLTRSADSFRFNAEYQPLKNHQIDKIQREVSDKLVRTAK